MTLDMRFYSPDDHSIDLSLMYRDSHICNVYCHSGLLNLVVHINLLANNDWFKSLKIFLKITANHNQLLEPNIKKKFSKTSS